METVLRAPDNDRLMMNSIELCGGTHIQNTLEAEAFAIIGS